MQPVAYLPDPDTLSDITIIIPAFNEEGSIGKVVGDIKSAWPTLKEVIVIDDGSTDQTRAIAKQSGATVISHKQNRGYGASLKDGIRAAASAYVITMDADGQHSADMLASLMVLARDNDMVIGHRQGLMHSEWWRMPGKWFLSLLANYLARRRIPDLNSGLRLIRRETALRYLHLCPKGFSFSTTITMALISRSYRVTYVPIVVRPRTGRSTVKLTTGLDTIILILRIATLFDPLRVFIPISFMAGLGGVLWGIPYALAGRGVSVASMLAIVTGILLFGLGLLCDQISQLRLERYE